MAIESTPGRWTYDVFLSFRGEDTRNNFVDHLYSALDQAGIYTFKDDQKLQQGKSISPELMKAIEGSMVAVVVFSKNYADSCWCLDELAKIMECRDLMGQRVLPVFYDVDPSDVRGQKRSYHAAFELHKLKFLDNADKVKRWRDALVTAANLSGWDVSKTASGHEAECIKQIVRNISSCTPYYPTDSLIGMTTRVQNLKSLLDKGSDDVRIIGIWGMGGIGKTTIARAVYHQISYEFEGSSFVEDVRENGSDKRGLKSLQQKLLSEVLMEKCIEIKDCDDGIWQIRRRLRRKKVLIVLDDVDNIKQLEFLGGARDWFGPGSRIMVTTRDEHLLSYAQEKYVPKLLEETEAMKLFSRYAFNTDIPPEAYEKLSLVVVNRTGHLPLALKVLGSHFCGQNLDFWQSALNVLAKIPHKDIIGILKISYDGLNIFEKKILLYIACFFKGRERYHVTRILDSFGFEAVSGIAVLIQKSLLTISDGNLHMHDLIQEMGRFIVCKWYPNTMEWISEEIKEVMETTDRLEIVEAIVETRHFLFPYYCLPCGSAEVFKSTKKLSLLEVKGRFTWSEPTYFPEQLNWLCWSSYPFESLRITTGMTKLVGLEMRLGKMQQLQIENKIVLTSLKFMDLSGSSITSSPDVSGIPNLERLNLSNCSCLVEVHQSVLLHERIVHLDLSCCYNLQILPSPILMKSLQTLHLNQCASLERFPEVSREMARLLVLDINGCDMIRTLPSSIRLLTGLSILIMGTSIFVRELKRIYFDRINKLSRSLTSLRILVLRQNNLVEDDFPTNHNAWPSLEELDLSWNLIARLPAILSQLSYIKYLNLSDCINLKELHELPSLIQVLRADDCKSLQKIGDFSKKYKWLFKISLRGCHELLKDQQSQSHLEYCLMKSLLLICAAMNHRLSVAVPGNKIPKWFGNQRLGDKTSLNLSQNQISKMSGLGVCCLLHSHWMETSVSLRIKFKPSGGEKLVDTPASPARSADHVWIGYMSIDFLESLCHGFESEDLIISADCGLHDIVECGVCVVYKDDIRPMTGIGSWIPDYDDLVRIQHDCASDDLQHGRWSIPTILFGNKGSGNLGTAYIEF